MSMNYINEIIVNMPMNPLEKGEALQNKFCGLKLIRVLDENILEILSRNTSKSKRVINEIENQKYNFDRKKLVEIGKYVSAGDRAGIINIITSAAKGVGKVKKEIKSSYIDILADEFMDPIKSKQLLSAMIYISNPDYFRFTKKPNEDIYFEILD